MRKRLSYANVTATIALVLAAGTGGAWAVDQINGSQLKDHSVAGKKLKDNTVKGKQVKESSLGKVPDAKDADTLDGVGVNGFMRGKRQAGRDTGTGTSSLDDPGVVQTLSTSVGQFRLSCGFANADARYFNTTAGDADVFMSFVPDGTETGSTHDTIAPNGERGYAATNGTGPTLVELRVTKGTRVAVLRVGSERQGTACTWSWELITSG